MTEEAWSRGEELNPAPGDASKRPPNSRGQIFTLPPSGAAVSYAAQSLRLDAGTWSIRLGRIDEQGKMVAGGLPLAPPALDSLFPVECEIIYGIGAATWTESTGFPAYGGTLVRTADAFEVRIKATSPLAGTTRVLAAASRATSSAAQATHLVTDLRTLAAADKEFYAIPLGARRGQLASPDSTALQVVGFYLSNGVAMGETVGVAPNLGPPWFAVPANAAAVRVVAAANGPYAMTWECEA